MADPVPPLAAFRKRQSPRVSQAELAQRIGVSTSHLSRVERFGTTSLPLALTLARITGLPVADFAPTGQAVI